MTPNTDVFKGAGNHSEIRAPYQDANGTWHNGLYGGLETTAMHTKIARIWQDQCISFDTFTAGVEAQVPHKIDVSAAEPTVRLRVADIVTKDAKGKQTPSQALELNSGVRFTPNGIGSLVKFTTLTPATIEDLMSSGYVPTVAMLINSELDKRDIAWAETVAAARASGGYRRRDIRQFVLRERQDQTTKNQVVRAVVSERYGVLNNIHAMEMIRNSFPNGTTKDLLASHPTDDGDNIFVNLFVPDYLGGNSEYAVGIAVVNSEIGKYKFRVLPFIFRAVCLNGMIHGKINSSVNIDLKHLGDMQVRMPEIQRMVKNAVQTALSMGNDLIHSMNNARDIRLDVPAQKVIASLGHANLTKEQTKNWWEAIRVEELDLNRPTAYQIVNGLTRAAQNYSGNTRMEMEMKAGELLTPEPKAGRDAQEKQWKRYTAAAAMVTEETVKQYAFIV